MNTLKKLRKQFGLSSKSMALLMGTTTKQYKEYEKNPVKMPASKGARVSEIFSCSMSEIFLPQTSTKCR